MLFSKIRFREPITMPGLYGREVRRVPILDYKEYPDITAELKGNWLVLHRAGESTAVPMTNIQDISGAIFPEDKPVTKKAK